MKDECLGDRGRDPGPRARPGPPQCEVSVGRGTGYPYKCSSVFLRACLLTVGARSPGGAGNVDPHESCSRLALQGTPDADGRVWQVERGTQGLGERPEVEVGVCGPGLSSTWKMGGVENRRSGTPRLGEGWEIEQCLQWERHPLPRPADPTSASSVTRRPGRLALTPASPASLS